MDAARRDTVARRSRRWEAELTFTHLALLFFGIAFIIAPHACRSSVRRDRGVKFSAQFATCMS
jgi:hypothetical protein